MDSVSRICSADARPCTFQSMILSVRPLYTIESVPLDPQPCPGRRVATLFRAVYMSSLVSSSRRSDLLSYWVVPISAGIAEDSGTSYMTYAANYLADKQGRHLRLGDERLMTCSLSGCSCRSQGGISIPHSSQAAQMSWLSLLLEAPRVHAAGQQHLFKS